MLYSRYEAYRKRGSYNKVNEVRKWDELVGLWKVTKSRRNYFAWIPKKQQQHESSNWGLCVSIRHDDYPLSSTKMVATSLQIPRSHQNQRSLSRASTSKFKQVTYFGKLQNLE